MEELDLLKKDWKRNENSFSQVTEKEIYTMLHKKSSSIVRWILIISILEVCFWTALNFLPGTDEYLLKAGYADFITYEQLFNTLNYAVVIVFIYLFYRNYIRISATASTKQLMKDIIRTRNTVNYYVWYNVIMIIVIFIFGLVIGFICNPDREMLRQKVSHDNVALVKVLALLVICVGICAVLAWLFYKLVYGTLLRKLLSNYKELKKIDF
jgi:hypothetical protein